MSSLSEILEALRELALEPPSIVRRQRVAALAHDVCVLPGEGTGDMEVFIDYVRHHRLMDTELEVFMRELNKAMAPLAQQFAEAAKPTAEAMVALGAAMSTTAQGFGRLARSLDMVVDEE